MNRLFGMGKRLIRQYKIELAVFVFLLIKLFKPYVSKDNLPVMSARFLAEAALFALLSRAVGSVVRAAGAKRQSAVLIVAAFFLTGYVSNSVFLLDGWFADTRVFFNAFAVAGSVASFIVVGKAKWKWLLPVYCFVCAAAVPYFVFSLLPSLVLLLIYRIKTQKKKNEYKDLLASSLIASGIAFFLFNARRVFIGADSFAEALAANGRRFALSVASVLPLIIVFALLWADTRKNSAGRPFKTVVAAIALEPLVALVSLALKADDGNLVMASMFVKACFLCYFVIERNAAVLGSLEKAERFFKKNWLLVFLSLIYLSAFSSFFKALFTGLTKTKNWFGLWH